MNPEIRFRIPQPVYQLAEERAEQLLDGNWSGRSTAVSTLARQAFYASLGLDEETADSTAPLLEVEVHFRYAEGYRRDCLLKSGQRLPRVGRRRFGVEPPECPPVLREHVELNSDGGGCVRLHLEEHLEVAGAEPDLQMVLACLERLDSLVPGPQSLADWAREHGSELLRLRLEEGFEWQSLARQERCRNLLEAAGVGPVEAVREEAGLGQGEEPTHALIPDREPTLERIQRLRQLREQVPQGVQVSLVRARLRSGPGAVEDRIAFRWALPDGSRLTFLLQDGSAAPSRRRRGSGLAPD